MTYVALLRGVGPTTAPNHKLIAVFESLGFTNVQSVVSSGNIIFESTAEDRRKLEAKIEHAIAGHLNLKSLAIVLGAAEFHHAVAAKPFGGFTHGQKTYLAVTFFREAPAVEKLRAYPEKVSYAKDIAALCTVNDRTTEKASFMVRLERAFGKGNTTRTWDTLVKIDKKLP